MNNRPIIIYHAGCLDGFGAAYAAWTKYRDNADYIPAHYGDAPPHVANREVYILDFSYPADTLVKMGTQARTVTILDHHKTAQADIEPLLKRCIIFGEFDMNRSGAVMAWNHFHPNTEAPRLLLHIQDRDLWQWKYALTKQITAGLMLIHREFTEWHQLVNDAASYQRLIRTGEAIVEYQDACIKKVMDSEIPMEIVAGHKVPFINCTHLISEIGNELAKGHPFAALYFDTADARIFSLRSANDGIDVSEIAKRFGGGGHYHAAGFKIKKTPLMVQ